MEAGRRTHEIAISTLSPLAGRDTHQTLVDTPLQGSLVFDRAQRIVHASSGLRAVLRLDDELPAVGESAMKLLTLAVGTASPILGDIQQWLDQSQGKSQRGATPTVNLLTATDARTIQARVSCIGEQYWIAEFEDLTVRLKKENGIAAASFQDTLTGIGNRSLFEHRLDDTLNQLAAGETKSATVLLLDLDRFKAVNDTLGHPAGDSLLRVVSERLQSSLREGDTLARLGGDEFAILLADCPDRDEVLALAVRIIDLVQRTYLIGGQIVNVGASIGIAVAPVDGATRDILLKRVDLALYYCKAVGRGVAHFFESAMEEKAKRRRALEFDLRKALVLRQFELHYQPQIDVDHQTIIGLEGLLRWRHPQRGLVLPGEFLAVTEEIGLAVAIGDWVLKTACREATRWPDLVTVAVNISPLQFEMGKFAESVEHALIDSDLPGCRLEIEVTEDILLRNGASVRGTLEALRALGVKVAMDGFGTGVASLSHLVNFPFDKIKIDRSLIDMREDGAKHRAIVRAICALGQSLGISTLAEGVETPEQLVAVRSEGCDSVQGFYYSKAVPANEVTTLFSNILPAAESRQLANKDVAIISSN